MTRKRTIKQTSGSAVPGSGILLAAACCVASIVVPLAAIAQDGIPQDTDVEDTAAEEAVAQAAARDANAPPALFIDVNAGLSYEDRLNRDGAFEATTGIGIGYFTSTSDQRLSFETGVTARARDGDGGADLIDPFVTIAYAWFNRDYEIGGDLSYSRAEIEGDDLDDDFDAADLARQAGTREDIGLGLRLVTGRTAPFGTDTEVRYAEQNFTDGATDDDSVTYTARSTLRFRVDPRIDLTLTGFWEREETDDAVDTVETTRRLTFGANLAVDRVWSVATGLGYSEIETATIGGVAVQDGVEGFVIVTRDMRNGSLVFSSDHVVTNAGWRNSVRVGRNIALANGDTFDASIGQIFFEEGDSGHLASLTYTRTVRSGALSFGFDYASDLDNADELIQRTRLSGTLRQDLTDASGWSVDWALARVDYDNPATQDAMRVDIGLAYLHALSNDWNLSARLEHQVLYADGNLDDRTNTFSLNLERRFSVRP
jgi:hypothetical protein